MTHLSNEGGGSVGVVLEGRRKLLGELVVPGKAVDPALDENKMELGILILPVPLKMLANIHSLLDEAVKILGDLRGETLGLEDTDDGVASDNLHAGHGLRVTEKDTNLRGGKSLSGELHDALDDLVELLELARKGLTPSQIGVLLRDSEAVPRVKVVTGNTIVRILKAKGLAPEIPEDLYCLIKKAVNVRKHLERNRQDKDAKFHLILIESRIHRISRYYKLSKKLPTTFKYDSNTRCCAYDPW
eukprot:CAMPEP_0113918178 /NCGR_PEP_ID=MMETSP0780_2-20120614/33183_1 /TAXON_ID=652834 /ORGANISM="Palpitomonas bilix" /LENGTH=243 /DNA_ID=CAMNT_0000917909 /DNA_START=67 /DNA_END=799 /DNA_ORIENTATION=+ /assembly_acc=CAM_ASM_000599